MLWRRNGTKGIFGKRWAGYVRAWSSFVDRPDGAELARWLRACVEQLLKGQEKLEQDLKATNDRIDKGLAATNDRIDQRVDRIDKKVDRLIWGLILGGITIGGVVVGTLVTVLVNDGG